MTIESYLSNATDYGSLTNAERNAICAAMEGEFVWIADDDYWVKEQECLACGFQCGEVNIWSKGHFLCLHQLHDFDHWFAASIPYYIQDGTAALRLVARFRMRVEFGEIQRTGDSGFFAGFIGRISEYYGTTPAAAIVYAVCELARAEYSYKTA